jgi:dihydroxy-acid dehydratase
MGVTALGSASIPAMLDEKDAAAERAGRIVMDLLARNVRPRDLITRQSIDNAIAAVAASGGSTNAVLHLLAIAREAGVELTSTTSTHQRAHAAAGDLKPGGRYVATDLHRAGGNPLLAQRLSKAASWTASRRRSPAEHWPRRPPTRETPGQDVILPLDGPAQAERRAGDPARQSGA